MKKVSLLKFQLYALSTIIIAVFACYMAQKFILRILNLDNSSLEFLVFSVVCLIFVSAFIVFNEKFYKRFEIDSPDGNDIHYYGLGASRVVLGALAIVFLAIFAISLLGLLRQYLITA